MQRTLSLSLALLSSLWSGSALAKDSSTIPEDSEKARVFITDSQSWEIAAYGGGTAGGGGSTAHGGARPQTAEIIKTFGERCPQVTVNNLQQKADYIVLLDHEGGKSFVRHKNKVAVFARVSGDSIVSKSTVSLGGSVQDACEAINKDWAAHGAAIRAAAAAATAAESKATSAPPMVPPPPPPLAPPVISTGKLSVASIPDGADIEIDGNFVGNTPSEVQLGGGDHAVSVKKTGFKDWERKLKVTPGSSVHLNAELEKVAAQ